MALWLIKRGPRPDHHKANFHPIILCDRKPVAKWQAGDTNDRAWVWSHPGTERAFGWLLERWEGLDIDYGHVVHTVTLPDGTKTAFWHAHARPEINEMLRGAVWWSQGKMKPWLVEAGVVPATDEYSIGTIANDYRYAAEARRYR